MILDLPIYTACAHYSQAPSKPFSDRQSRCVGCSSRRRATVSHESSHEFPLKKNEKEVSLIEARNGTTRREQQNKKKEHTMRIPQKFILLILCLLQYAIAASTNASLPMDATDKRNDERTTNLRRMDRTGGILQDTSVAESPVAPMMTSSRNLKEDGDNSGYDMSNMNMDNVNIDEYTQRPQELFSTPITEWTTEDWILAGVMFLILSCLLSCLAKIGCGACNLLNCLTCYCCYHLCCGDTGVNGSNYVPADSLC